MTSRRLRYIFGCLALVYLGLTLLLPADPAVMDRYDLSAGTLHLIQLSVALPLVLIWSAAAYGYSRLRTYGRLIANSVEGRSVSRVANGLLVLALGLPLQYIIVAILQYIMRLQPGLESVLTIIINYIGLVVPLVAFVWVAAGVRQLADAHHLRPSVGVVHGHVLILALLSISYTYLVLRFAFLNGGVAASYRMPVWLVLATLVMPYVYTWSIGLYSAYTMFLYNTTLKGVIYRRAWMLLSFGLVGVIVVQIITQYLTTLTVQLDRLSFNVILLVVYGLLLLMAAGFVSVALGAKRLQKIEEV